MDDFSPAISTDSDVPQKGFSFTQDLGVLPGKEKSKEVDEFLLSKLG